MRAAHGRGHSRTASMSISFKAGTGAMTDFMSASVASSSGVSTTTVAVSPVQPPAPSQRPSSMIGGSNKRRSIIFGGNNAGGHMRGHSRSGSRALNTLPTSSSTPLGLTFSNAETLFSGQRPQSMGRPASIIAGTGKELPKILAVENGPGMTAASFAPGNRDAWADEEESGMSSSAETEGTERLATVGMSLTPSSSSNDLRLSRESSSSLTPLASPARKSNALLQEEALRTPSSLFGVPASSSVNSSANAGTGTSTATKRMSRHARRSSVATKRESMEIMGGLGLNGPGGMTFYSPAEKRNSLFCQSGLMPASMLFGAPESPQQGGAGQRRSTVRLSVRGDQNGQGVLAQQQGQEDEDGWLSALEKLEGKSRGSSPAPVPLLVPGETNADEAQVPMVMLQENTPSPASARQFIPGPQSAPTSRLRFSLNTPATPQDHLDGVNQSGSRSSVQLPSFDDLHGAGGMDKRASLVLLEANELTTGHSPDDASSKATSAGPNMTSFGIKNALDSLAIPIAGESSSPRSFRGSPVSSPKKPTSPLPNGRALSSSPGTPGLDESGEGLGTLVEEEEPEESSTPPTSALALQNVTAEHAGDAEEDPSGAADIARKEREEELERIKLSRRLSLTPKQPRLKNRPASLFLAPALRNGLSSTESSPAPNAGSIVTEAKEPIVEDAEEEEAVAVKEQIDDVGELKRGWSMAKAQRNAGKADLISSPPSTTLQTRKQAWRMSLPSTVSGPASEALRNATAGPAQRVGMRTLRLSSIGSQSPSTGDSNTSFGSSTSSEASVPSSSTPPYKKRSSIIYKPSDSAGSGLSRSTSGGIFSSLPRSSSNESIASSTASVTPAQTFSPAAWDELKTRAQRDGALLESTRKQLDALQKELAGEKVRAQREYIELEQHFQAEKQALADKLAELEAQASARAAEASEAHGELEKLRELLEETEAERDTYQEDVEGWRTRCSDLEKGARTEQARSEMESRARIGLAGKAKRLAAQLQALGHEISEEDEITEEDIATPSEAAAVALGRASSPIRSGGGGYFSPHLPAPEQTVKLLADMRQQIFNLANTLEHERKQRAEVEEQLQSTQSQQTISQDAREEPPAAEQISAPDQDETQDDSQEMEVKPLLTSEPVTIISPGRNKKKAVRHVFAYDSSAGSFGQSSASMGSQSISMTTVSDGQSDEEGFAKAQAALNAASEEDDDGDFSLATGRGALQTLDEVEEEALSDAAPTEPQYSDDTTPVRPSVDLEGAEGGLPLEEGVAEKEGQLWRSRNSIDTKWSGRPVLMQGVPIVAVEGNVLDLTSPRGSDGRQSVTTMPSLQSGDDARRDSDESSYDSQVLATPPQYREEEYPEEGYRDDESEEEEFSMEEARPEFIPEWSFHKASQQAVRLASKSSKYQRHNKMPSVEDFFGIMTDSVLPPLPTSSASLDMPPVYIEYASYAGNQDVSNSNRYAPYSRFEAQTRASISDSSDGARQSMDSNASSYFSRATGMLSGRVTNAISGLSGYLTNQSVGNQSVGSSGSARHYFDSYDGEISLDKGAQLRQPYQRRQDAAPSVASVSSQQSMTRPAKRFLPRYSGPPLVATPTWELDFTKVTGGAGSHPIIVL